MSDTDTFDWRAAIRFLSRKLEYLDSIQRTAEILFVDDDESDFELFKRACSKYECNLTYCHNSEEAMRIIREKRFDLAFIDQKMPRITGTEILMASMPHPTTKFILVTGFPDSRIADDALKLGALFAPKPITEETLSFFNIRRKNE